MLLAELLALEGLEDRLAGRRVDKEDEGEADLQRAVELVVGDGGARRQLAGVYTVEQEQQRDHKHRPERCCGEFAVEGPAAHATQLERAEDVDRCELEKGTLHQ